MSSSTRRVLRWLVPLAILALAIAACDPEEDPDDVAEEDPEEEPEDPEEPEDEEEPDEVVEVEDFTYTMGMFDDMDADNYWAYLADTDVWTGYVIDGEPCTLYGLTPPNFTLTPSLAAEAPPEPEEDGDVYFVEIDIHDGVNWSDGEPITAQDMEFTFDTVVDLNPGGQWGSNYGVSFDEDTGEFLEDESQVRSVEALDDTTVRIEFNTEPGLGFWPIEMATAPIMPEHYWGDLAADVDDVADFLAESGQGTPSCAPYEFVEWEEGAFAASEANEEYFLEGTEYTHYSDGSIHMVNEDLGIDDRFGLTGEEEDEVVAEYTVGPYADEVLYEVYGEASVAVSALVDGEIPFLLTGPGIEEAQQDEIIDSEEVEAVINPDYGMQYLGFNFMREPMDDTAFRQAVGTIIDREFITDDIFGGGALPLYTFMPSGNEAWWNEEVGEELAEQWQYDDMTQRVLDAAEILADAGYTWAGQEPDIDEETGEVIRGEGLTDPDGEEIRELDLQHPTAGYDPLRNTAGLQIADMIEQLGVEVDAQALEFGQLLENTPQGQFEELDFDMHILGWSLGNVAYPTYYEAMFASDGVINNTGHQDEGYDEAAAAFLDADSLDEAYDILWEDLEPYLQEELPYVPLFDTPNVEGYRPDEVQYPYTEVLGGLEFVNGQPELVRPAAE